MTEDRVHVGLVGAVHPNMPGDDTGLYRGIIERMRTLSMSMGFDLSVFQDPLRSEDDGKKARNFMDDNHVDFTLLFNASLPYGRVILPLARVRSRIGLWSVGEPSTSGVLQLNSFCGTNMLGAIISNYLNLYDIPFKWFYGMPDSPQFQERFLVTLRALSAIKKLEHSRIAQIGGLADGFEDLYIDERVLEKRFGTFLQTRYSVEEIVERAKKYTSKEVASGTETLRGGSVVAKNLVNSESMERAVRVYLALRDFATENRYDALAVSCWKRFQEVYGVAICAALSRLNEEGIVAPCEGDVASATMMLILNAINGKRAALNDLVAFDEKDASLNLWHCGVAPASWADRTATLDSHFNIGRYEGERWVGEGVVVDMTFRPGALTVAAMNNGFDDLLILTGEVIAGKRGFSGSGGWVGKLRLNDAEMTLQDLMNTLVVRKVNHHYASAFGNLTNELNEFASWKRMRVIQAVPYRPYLQIAQ